MVAERVNVDVTARSSFAVFLNLSVRCALSHLQFDPKRSSYQAGPETYSITFDESGLVSKITVRWWCSLIQSHGHDPVDCE